MTHLGRLFGAAWFVAALIAGCNSSSLPPASDDGGASSDGGAAADVADAAPADAAPDAASADGASSCPLPGKLGSPLCEACISAHCCAEVHACSDDPACSIVLKCMQACLLAPNAGPCIDKCLADTPAGAAKYKAFDACVAGVPPQGCGIDCSE